jgi:hypothetical protein
MAGRAALPLVLALAASAVGAQARGADGADLPESPDEHYTLRGELGPELDSNVHRTEIIHVPGTVNAPVVSSPLARAVLSGSLSDVVGDGHLVAMSATLAAKVFEKAEARDEDVGIAESTLLWRAPLGPSSALALSGAYYEAFQREAPAPTFGDERRDFRSITPSARFIGRASEQVDLGVGGGYRLFVFKPDQSFDFNGPTASADARWARETADGVAEWDAAVRAVYERRAFAGAPYVEPVTCTMPCPPVLGTGARLDHFATAAVDLSRTGARLLVGAGYALHLNFSNSFGETVTRHFINAHVAASLPLDLYVAVHAEIVFAYYADHVFVAPPNMAGSTYSSIEDENRNSIRVDLSRNLTERLQLIARYSFYANSSTANDVTYRRQTALISLAYTFEK